ncbi:MAG: LamG-like jellyroll fold domain-containing protein [Ignavibacteria bacterium]
MKKIIYISFLFCLLINSESYAQYYFNQYTYTDGVNDYYATASHPELILDSAFTIEGWVLIMDTLGFSKTLLSTVNSSNSQGYAILVQGNSANPGNAGKLQLNLNGSNNFFIQTANVRFSLNNWTHFAISFQNAFPNNDTLRFYINGGLVQTFLSNVPPISNTSDSLRIGNCYIPNNYTNGFRGSLDDIRIYKTERITAIIQNDRGVPITFDNISDANLLARSSYYSVLTAAWAFNGNGNDKVGFNNNLTAINGAGYVNNSFNPEIYRKQSNYYARYIGSSWFSGVDVTNSGFDLDTAATLEAWINIDAYRAQPQTIISKGTSAYSYILGIGSSPANSPYLILNNGAKFIISARPITPRVWTHIAATYRSSTGTLELYVNGVLDTSRTVSPGDITVSNDSLFIGRNLFGDYFYGRIDETRISKFVKTQNEVKKYLYTNLDNLNYSGSLQVCYGFEGNTIDKIGLSNPLLPRGFTYFEWLNLVATAAGYSQAPILRTNLTDSGFISDSYILNGAPFIIRNNVTRFDSILASGVSGAYKLNVLVLLTHTYMDDVDLTLRAPNGMTVALSTDNGGTFNDMMTVFDDFADSTVNDFSSPYSMKIKPQVPLSTIQSAPPNGYWRLTVTDDNVTNIDSGVVYKWGLQFSPATGIANQNEFPEKFELFQNFPNPFNPITRIKFDIPDFGFRISNFGFTRLAVYDILGREVAVLVNEELKPGSFEVEWDASNYSSGVYFYKIEAGSFTDSKKMVLVR